MPLTIGIRCIQILSKVNERQTNNSFPPVTNRAKKIHFLDKYMQISKSIQRYQYYLGRNWFVDKIILIFFLNENSNHQVEYYFSCRAYNTNTFSQTVDFRKKPGKKLNGALFKA